MVTTKGEELADQQRARKALNDAHHAVDQVQQALDSRPMCPAELREAVAGTVAVVGALTTVVGHLMLHAPVALAGHDGMIGEVVADLRALRGCLITGARLAEPALDGLQALPTPDRGGHAQGGQHAIEHGQAHADRSASAQPETPGDANVLGWTRSLAGLHQAFPSPQWTAVAGAR